MDATAEINSIYVGKRIDYAGVSTYVFYIDSDDNHTVYAVNPMPISESCSGLERGAKDTSPGIYSDNSEKIGYGVKNSQVVLDTDGTIQSGKDKALIPYYTDVSKTVWHALQEIKTESAEMNESLKSQSVDGYGWFILSIEEIKQNWSVKSRLRQAMVTILM